MKEYISKYPVMYLGNGVKESFKLFLLLSNVIAFSKLRLTRLLQLKITNQKFNKVLKNQHDKKKTVMSFKYITIAAAIGRGVESGDIQTVEYR